MDEGSLSSLTLIAVLIALHALIALAYAALAASPAAYLRDEAEGGNRRARRILHLSENLPQLQITTHLSLTLVRVAIIALATVMVKHPLFQLPEQVGAAIVPVLSYAVVLVPLALLVYLLGDLMPGTLGRMRAATIAPWVALPMRWLVVVFKPLAALCLVIERSLTRVSGGADVAQTVADEEIRSIVDEKGGVIESEEKEMILSVLEFGETLAREVMVPRLDVTAIDMEATLDEALARFVESGHSRIPVYEESIDNVKGVLYAKDLLNLWHRDEGAGKSIADLMRPAYFVPETKRADTLFKEMRVRKVHLAIVVDEYGGTAGLVTIEDLIEEIVGDIQDEYDVNEEVEYVRHSDDEYLVDASMNLDDFNDLMDVALSTEDNDTLGGYVFGQLGRVPEVGETLELADEKLRLRIDSVEGRRIRKIHVTRLHDAPEDAEATSSEDAGQPQQPADAEGRLKREMSTRPAQT